MNKKSFAYKNILLNTEFNKYLVEHPEVADEFPDIALVVLLPEDDPPLCRKNLALARRHREKISRWSTYGSRNWLLLQSPV